MIRLMREIFGAFPSVMMRLNGYQSADWLLLSLRSTLTGFAESWESTPPEVAQAFCEAMSMKCVTEIFFLLICALRV